MVNNKINVNVIDGLQPILDRIIDYDNITNCITEIPQDIKLELKDGELTLKAGSKVYVPNSAGKFDEVTVASDISSGNISGIDADYMFFLNPSRTGQAGSRVSTCYSGTTAPSSPSTGTFWYDTTNNSVKRWSGSAWVGGFSLPFSIIASGAISSIDQVFNGFGYIGSTVFALPGVKTLNPNGRNADGTLNNVEIVSSSVIVRDLGSYAASDYVAWLNTSNTFGVQNKSRLEFDYNNNYFVQVDGAKIYRAPVVSFAITSSGVTSLNPKLPFRAVDQNDFNKLDEEAVKTSGNQSIAGIKTFKNQVEFLNEGAIYASSSTAGARDNRFRCKFYQYGLSDEVYPTNTVFSGIHHYDKNNFEYGTIFSSMSPTGVVQTNLWVHTPKGTAATMGIQQDANGNTSTYAPTPATNSNSNQIATTAFFRNNMQVVTALPSSPTAGVFYFVKE